MSQNKPRHRNSHRRTNAHDQVNNSVNKQPENLYKITSVRERPHQNTQFTFKDKAHNLTAINRPIQESTVARIKYKKNKCKCKHGNKQSRCQSNNLCVRIKTVHQNQNKVKSLKTKT